jgi:hypothetical protein
LLFEKFTAIIRYEHLLIIKWRKEMNTKIKAAEAKMNVLLKEQAKVEKEHNKVVAAQETYLAKVQAVKAKAMQKFDAKVNALEEKIELLMQIEESKA